jgi:hypothetical protein
MRAVRRTSQEDIPMMQLRRGVAGVIAVFVAVSLSLSAQAAEKKKISGTYKLGQVVSMTTAYPGDDPKHELVQLMRRDTINSSDPNFNDIESMLYEQEDNVAGSGSHRGYTLHLHKNGERSYGVYEGTHKMTVKEGGAWEVTFEGKWQWTGGTGMFKNLKGNFVYKGKNTPEGGLSNWEGEAEY